MVAPSLYFYVLRLPGHEQSGSRSQIKLMYGSHHQQPQKQCRYDELDPFLVVREPSMHAIHGQPPFRLPCFTQPKTLS
jgi:hypothetical protein